ncbi:hypothetical protein IV203_017799 [Nitzschia inconspicua]|uniref:Uncharacterized protein n=1 Tax=Nitzschia inconspicua TaxID=303405 RepID=A0A9K3K757_9STRA|nr:hypothetical protein IV203_024867 [Nitzschia inconspicua]KAG7371658.1 hypothetical protein IV203_017799 [Nitzschia inconspicua]
MMELLFQAWSKFWTGPDSTPQRISVRSDNGMDYPFSAVLEVPPDQSSIAIRNLGPMEFPMGACVVADVEDAMAGGNKVAGTGAIVRTLDDLGMHMFINGEDSMESFRFEKHVESVQVLLKTDGRPLHARLELVQGPNDSKQTIDIFSENGETQPFWGQYYSSYQHGSFHGLSLDCRGRALHG